MGEGSAVMDLFAGLAEGLVIGATVGLMLAMRLSERWWRSAFDRVFHDAYHLGREHGLHTRLSLPMKQIEGIATSVINEAIKTAKMNTDPLKPRKRPKGE